MANFTMPPPEFFFQLGGGILSGQNIADGLGRGLTNASPVLAAQREQQQAAQQKDMTYKALMQIDPQKAEMFRAGVLTGPQAYSTFAEEKAKREAASKPSYKWMNIGGKLVRIDENAGKIEQMADYSEPAKRNLISTKGGLYDADTNQWVQPPADMADDGTEYGLNPIWVKDPKTGQQRLMVTSKDGTTKILDTQGLDPISPLKAIDTGTGTMLVDPRTAETNTTIKKDVAGQEEQTALGKEIGQIKAALPAARVTASIVAKDVEDLKKDPGLAWAVGPLDSRVPTMFPATARAESKIAKLKGSSFLQAREMLRGGGQITDFEGQRAEAAIARLSTAQSEEDFKDALDEYNSAVQEGLKKLEAVASGNLDFGKEDATPKANPAVDDLVEQYRTK